MSEKRVFVRLAAVGGRQVKAELQGVGDAGSRGLRRLSTEVDSANARLAAFARRAGAAASAIASAMAAAGVAITRATVQAANEVAFLSQVANTAPEVLQRWSAASQTVGIEQEKLADILKDVNDRVGDFLQTGGGPMADFFENIAPRVGVTIDQFRRLSGPEALQLYVSSLERAGLSQQEMTFYLEAMASDASRLIPLLRNNGEEMTRLGDRAASLGAVMDARAIAAMQRTQIALIGVGQVFEGMRNRIATAMAPMVEALANGFIEIASAGGVLDRAFTTVLDNLGRLATYAGTFAGIMAGRWVASLAVAALSVKGLTTALVFLRGALIRTGIGALVVGAGELVYQFTRLALATGGIGNALTMLRDVAFEVWDRVSLSASAAWARVESGWASAQAVIYDGLQDATDAVVGWGNNAVGTFQGAFDAVKAIWGSLPSAIGDFAFQAVNSLISGVESMLNGVVTRINNFLSGLNNALSSLPEWMQPDGGLSIGLLDPVQLGRVDNPFEGAAAAAGKAAGEAFRAAMGQTYVESPDLFGGMADDARGRASGYAEAARMLSDAASRPMTAWQALKDAVSGAGQEGEAALESAGESAERLNDALEDTEDQAGRAGGAARQAGEDAAAGAETARTGWQKVADTLADYYQRSRDIAGDIGGALVNAFQSAENAIGEFVKTGKLNFRDMVTSLIADLAKLGARKFILGPIANALSGALGGLGGISAGVFHSGGMVGATGPGRMVPAMAFANAPRMHNGGWAGLKSDEVPAILQRGERVLSRREARAYDGGGVTVNINARDAESFRQSRTQIAADIARAVSLGRRGM